MTELLMIFGGVLLRLVPHVPNFAPISATALFGGTTMKKRYAILIPLVAMLVSDYLLLYVTPFSSPMLHFSTWQPLSNMWHSTTPFVYGSFMLSGLIGLWLRRQPSASNIVAASLLCSLQFFLITNFGVWAGGAYSRDLSGLLTSYVMGLPFFQWTLLGDLFYSSVFFGTYALSRHGRLVPNLLDSRQDLLGAH